MKTILVTGANGFLGNHLIHSLIELKNYKILAFDINTEVIRGQFDHCQNIEFFNKDCWDNKTIPFEKVELVVHLAFGRAHKGEKDIASGLKFTNELFNQIIKFKIPELINISSQEVYGNLPLDNRKEFCLAAPNTIYGMAKFASELLANNTNKLSKTNVTSLRLAGLLGRETTSRMVNKFVLNALNSKAINIVGGKQVFSQLDVRDAVSGIIALIKTPSKAWKPVYNLGYLRSYSIIEIADAVTIVAKEFYLPEVKINLEQTDDALCAEMDSGLFYNDTGWRPRYDMLEIVRSIFTHQLQHK
jgi:nucleoside-diphosphate-sugar epimerase